MMIDVSELQAGDIITAEFNNGNTALCRFGNSLFLNIENNHHKYEIYGSSIVAFKGVDKK